MAFLAIDLETTGLDPEKGVILEVAFVVADRISDIDIESNIVSHVIRQDPDTLVLPAFVAKMHADSGLLADILDPAIPKPSLGSVDAQISVLLEESAPDGHILVGSSVQFDHAWIDKHMPYTAAILSHRHIDATSDWLLDEQAGVPEAEPPVIGMKHRAASDIATSVWHLQKSIARREASHANSR